MKNRQSISLNFLIASIIIVISACSTTPERPPLPVEAKIKQSEVELVEKHISAAAQCAKEVGKKIINKPLLEKVCLQAAKKAESNKGYSGASWYYLLSGKVDYLLTDIEKHLDSKTNTTLYATIAYAYVLSGDYQSAEKTYHQFIQFANIPKADTTIQGIYIILNKLYPGKKKNLKRGLQLWNRIYRPFLKIKAIAEKANYFYQKRKYLDAIKQYQHLLIVTKTQLRKKHRYITIVYGKIGTTYGDLGNYTKALEYEQKALLIREKVLGKQHPDTAASYNNIGLTYGKLGNYTKALEYAHKFLIIKENELGKQHLHTATSYHNIGFTYGKLGNHIKALEYEQKALLIREKVLGKQHPDIAQNYNNIGLTYGALGNHTKALEYTQKALAIREKVLGKQHPDIAESYNNIGLTYGALGNHTKALEYMQNALVIWEKLLGKQHPNTAKTYNNISLTYRAIGNYTKALENDQKALVIMEKVFGKQHPDTARSYNNIGDIYGALGNHTKALEYMQNALVIMEKVLGKQHPYTAKIYNNIGFTYGALGNYTKAVEYEQKTLAIREKVLGKQHPDTALSYNNIGFTYGALGNHTKALEYMQNALVIWEKVLGKQHPNTAQSYNNIGTIYEKSGNHSKALEYMQKALVIREKVLGKQNPDTAQSYNNIGFIYGRLGNHPDAYQYTKKSFAIFLQQRDSNFSLLDLQQKQQYLMANENEIDSLLFHSTNVYSALLENKKSKRAVELEQTTLNDWLAYKGSVLDSENRLIQFAKTSKDSVVKKKYQELVQLKQAHSKINQSYPASNKIEAWKEQLKQQKERLAQLEREIAQRDLRFKEDKNLQTIISQDIANSLTKTELYIDYAKTNDGYYIFTIDYKNKISFITLNKEDSKAIDNQVALFGEDIKSAIMAIKNNTSLNALNDSSKIALNTLYHLLIKKPLADQLANKTSLIISPDGALRLLPFEALYDKAKSNYLIQQKDIRYIASGKELVRLFHQQKKGHTAIHNDQAVLFANPSFDTKAIENSHKQAAIYTRNTDKGSTIRALSDTFDPLPGTKIEAEAIISILKKSNICHYYSEDSASEANLLGVQQPKILHIATHGFFDANTPNPMLKSGLVLAGANDSLNNDKAEGIVTALDLSGLDLKGTQLVVLSACNTGKVDPNSTDGISGLTKAFIQAGARYVVMSLWSVADQETASLMQAFYKESQTNNQQYAAALKQSKLDMIANDKYNHPYFWAAFVLSGL